MAYLYSTAMLTGAVLLCILIEHVAPLERHSLRSRFPGLTLQVVGGVGGGLLSIPIAKVWNLTGYQAPIIPIGPFADRFGLFGYVGMIVLGVMLLDFLRYWRHRAEHRWFWRIHVVHHSPTELHAANSLGHPLQVIPEVLFVAIPLALIDFQRPEQPIFVGLINVVLITYIHSPVDFHWGPLRRIFVDNRFHRIHHSLEPRHFDKNFANTFTLWDQMFGTAYMPGSGEWPDVGVAGVRPPRNAWQFLAMPFNGQLSAAPQASLLETPRPAD